METDFYLRYLYLPYPVFISVKRLQV